MRSDDYNESVASAAAGNAHDGLPAIVVSVFDAVGTSNLETWLVQNNMITNCTADSVLATEIDGKDASSCLWDGLYSGITIALLFDQKIYLFTGTREGDETADGYSYEKDFNELTQSVRVGS